MNDENQVPVVDEVAPEAAPEVEPVVAAEAAPEPPVAPVVPPAPPIPPAPAPYAAPKPAKDKTIAGILGILLGSLGIHKFYLGQNTAGIIMLLVSIISAGFLAPVMSIIGLVEGILYLTKSDEEFQSVYVDQGKAWF